MKDSDYLEAPGIVGELVRDIVAANPTCLVPFVYMAMVSLVGILKSATYEYPDTGLPPVLYQMGLCRTGRGKDFPQTLIAGILAELKLSQLADNGTRSNRGITRLVAENFNTGLLVIDEITKVLAILKNSEADYNKKINSTLLEMFSAHARATWKEGKTGDPNEDGHELHYPKLGLLGFGVPSDYQCAFSESNLTDGTLPRVRTMQDYREIPEFSFNTSSIDYPGLASKLTELAEPLVQLYTQFKIINEEYQRNIAIKKAKTAKQLDAAESASYQVNWIDSAKYQIPKHFIKTVYWSETAKGIYSQFANSVLLKLRNSEDKLLSDNYSRTLEQVGRLAQALAGDRVESEHVKFAIRDIKHWADHNLETLRAEFGLSDKNKLINRVVDALQKSLLKNLLQPVSFGIISQQMRREDPDRVKQALLQALEQELVIAIDTGRFYSHKPVYNYTLPRYLEHDKPVDIESVRELFAVDDSPI